MKYDEGSIAALGDALSIIRKRPKMFVGEAPLRPEFLAAALAHDALSLGVKHVEILYEDQWWVVISDEDWLTYHNRHDVRETFSRVLPVPWSVNGCRSEVIIHALASAVFTSKAGELVILSGDEATIREVLTRDPFCRPGNPRLVAFQIAEGS